jgi:hypothetical protein
MTSSPTLCTRCGTRPVAVSYNDPTTNPPVSGGYCIPCFHALAGARIRSIVTETGAQIPPETTDEELAQGLFGEPKSHENKWSLQEMARLAKEVADALPDRHRNPEFIDQVRAKLNSFTERRDDDQA